MAYTKVEYNPVNWKNKSEGLITPLDKRNLNNMDGAIKTLADSLDVAYNELDTKKLSVDGSYKIISETPTWDEKTGILRFKFYDGTEFVVDFNVEKIPVSFSMDEKGIITMTTEDGTEWTADIGSLTPNYVYDDNERIAVTTSKSEDGSTHVSFDLKKGSITNDYLANDYLASIIAETVKAQTASSDAKKSADSASESASNAAYDAKLAQSYAIGGSEIRDGEDVDNAKYYANESKNQAKNATDYAIAASANATAAKKSADSASESATNASASAKTATDAATSATLSETNAKKSADNASNSATSATLSETNAKKSADSASASENSASASATSASTSESNARVSADSASTSASNASTSETNAKKSADSASTSASNASTSASNASASETNAKKYYEQTKSISESFAGTLRPKGTVTFANLPSVSLAETGDMYNVSDEFATTTDFAEGAGNTIPLGSNVYKNSDGKWDVLAGSPVTGVKGSAETVYRRGNVNITKENLGLDNVDNTSDSEKRVSYATSAGSADSATKASNDSANQKITSTYVKGVGIKNHTVTVTKGDGTSSSFEVPDTDTNTTYSLKKAGSKIQLVGSDGSTTEVTDENTTYDLDTMINALPVGTDDPVDNDYYVSQNADGGTSNTGYFRRPVSKLWNYIKTKLATVATSGSYTDLSNKPTIGNGKVTVNQNGTTKGTFTMNQTGDTIINLTDSDTNTNTWRDVVDSLDSTRTDASLSANQGRVLNDKFASYLPLHGTADIAASVADYGDTAKHIQIGFSGAGITDDDIKYIAGYTGGDGGNLSAKIKDISKDALKSWLGLGSRAYDSTSYLPLSGGDMSGDITFNGHGASTIGNGGKDGAGLDAKNNLNIASWYGVSFTSKCAGFAYSDKPGVSIDCRNGTLAVAGAIYANGGVVGDLTGNAATATTANSANSANELKSITLTGGDGNTAGFRLIASINVGAHWSNYRANFIVRSRHQGNGLLCIAAGCNSNVHNKENTYAQIRYYGNTISGDIIKSSRYQAYLSPDCKTVYLFWLYEDYSEARLTPVYGSDFEVSNGTWMTSIDESTYGTCIAQTEINCANGGYCDNSIVSENANHLYNTQSDGSKNSMTFNWAGKDGQPTWLWGGEDGSNMYVYNPSNFSVNSAGAIRDSSGNGNLLSASYSKDGLEYSAYSWLAAWNGTELRAVHKNQFATANHTHNYLPLSGGTITGRIFKVTDGSWIGDRDRAIVYSSTPPDGGYGCVACMPTKHGTWTIGNLGGNEHLIFNYASDTNYSANKNETTHVYLRPTEGTIALTKDIPTSLPASDVYAWAKASSKPSYSWGEISGRPTALSSFTNDSGFITGISKSMVTDALGYTPALIRPSTFHGTMGTSSGDGGRIGTATFEIPKDKSGKSVRIIHLESNYSLTTCSSPSTSGTTVTVNVHSDTITSGNPSFGGRVLYMIEGEF